MDFPVFRKYKNNKSYFKILSEDRFEEIRMGINGCEITTYRVSQLPDRNFLNDMLHDYEPYWEEIKEKEYRRIKESC